MMGGEKVGFVLFFTTLLFSPFSAFGEGRVLREIGDLKRNMSNLEREVSGLRREVSNLKREVSNLKREVGEIKGELRQMNKRFDDMNKRLDKVEREIGDLREEVAEIKGELKQMGRMLQELSKRMDDMKDVMIAMFAGLVVLVISVIGFAFWDRRTILRRAVEESRAQIEAEGKLKDVIRVLKELAKTDKKVEEAMRKVGLL